MQFLLIFLRFWCWLGGELKAKVLPFYFPQNWCCLGGGAASSVSRLLAVEPTVDIFFFSNSHLAGAVGQVTT